MAMRTIEICKKQYVICKIYKITIINNTTCKYTEMGGIFIYVNYFIINDIFNYFINLFCINLKNILKYYLHMTYALSNFIWV